MKIITFYLLCFITLSVNAQKLISGQVIDQETNKPISGASIYINNSTIGTTTDNKGKFALSVPNSSNKIELIVSSLSYVKKTILVNIYDDKYLLIDLEPKSNTLNEVTITNHIKKEYFNRWGSVFSKLLFGSDRQFAINCKIINPEVLIFYFDKKNQELAAYSSSPLIIENYLTKYRIHMELNNFNYGFNTQVLDVSYSTFFEEMDYSKRKETAVMKWRYAAYYGSQMHFMRAVHYNNLPENGYKLYKLKFKPNIEKQRVSLMFNENKAVNLKNNDSINYYKKVLKQPDSLIDTCLIDIKKFIKRNQDLETVNFNSKDSLMVVYYSYLDKNNKKNLIDQKNETLKNIDFHKKEETILLCRNNDGVNVQSNGYYEEPPLFFQGAFFDKRISQLLPWDFYP